jgi:murein DD-endopeptidase MepM/ murein hydrolase activator NlpD
MRPRKTHSKKTVTVMVIPHHGASLFQWHVPRWAWYLGLSLGLGLLGSAVWIVRQHVQYGVELKRLASERDVNRRITGDLLKGKEAVIRVARLELELRKMLRYKSDKALFNADSIGGPSEDDVKHLSALLEERSEEAANKAGVDMDALMRSAKAREKSFNEIRQYVDKKRSLLASKPTAWPVHGWISSIFGARVSPLSGEQGFHTGVDIANDFGTPVRSTADGCVAYAGWEGGYGKLVVVQHGHGYASYYGHLSEIKAKMGQMVRRGTVLGLMGQTGDATGPHVHYEIRVYGSAVDPKKYME